MMKNFIYSVAVLVAMLVLPVTNVVAQNPYLPLWEHIPDGEPYVFEDPDMPGKYRVYIYGSHDSRRTDYCGKEQVVTLEEKCPISLFCHMVLIETGRR